MNTKTQHRITMDCSISVLMSVCSAESPEYLFAALESVFKQTLRPVEVILVKDGPLGAELDEIIKFWEEKERSVLRVFQIERNVGLANALNFGIERCSCELVARMDSNDISCENRFEKEAKCFYDIEVDVVGSYIEERDEKMDRVLWIRKVPLSNTDIAGLLGWKNPMNHVSVMFRKSSVRAVGGYPQELRKLQDYGLWAKMIKSGYTFKNIPECLVFVRTGKNFLERRGGMSYFRYEVAVLKYLKKSGHIGFIVFSAGVVIRFFTRISPISVRSLVYRAIRGF